jgi:hypothetical protein
MGDETGPVRVLAGEGGLQRPESPSGHETSHASIIRIGCKGLSQRCGHSQGTPVSSKAVIKAQSKPEATAITGAVDARP